ncbi:glutamyl-tRNA reductase [Haloechinothrix sp. LS1_15]|uniref:glutamyl-tRNA reductase n=1 Tax=Haloechinothrix sp. LS1_15 TaxID=2652248 RepID=UPI002946211B|nr:glutamyl-tRNA reductase [Haloechinothrix sp. LS1_15]MDV6012631.1 glutamyl-tRNA reductase [Haloechinothrix sp. LS1_15]
MSVLAVGLSHHTADLRTLERVTISQDEVPKTLHELQHAQDVSEVMLVSTCNRVEIYAIVESFHGGLSGVSSVLARMAGVDVTELYDNLYVHYAGAAVEHLFSVACGLDSMVVGETQILGQVRAAYATAADSGTVGSALHELVQAALRVGKRVHSETGLDALGASVVSKALEAAVDGIGDLAGRPAVIIGAGSMGALAASQLRTSGVSEVVVANRTVASAERLAASLSEAGVPARTVTFDELGDALAAVDLVVCCTGAQDVVLPAEFVPERKRQGELVICDLGLPRDADPAIAEMAGVRLVDLETVRHQVDASTTRAHTELAAEIIGEEVREYLAQQRSAAVTPTVAALRQQAAEVVDAELLRLDRRLPSLDEQTRDEVSRTVRRVVDKLLHAPTVRVKQLAAETGAEGSTDYAGALRELFGLDPAAPATVAQPTQQPSRARYDDGGGEGGAER